jgi:uroporphyrinogen decarboxylase
MKTAVLSCFVFIPSRRTTKGPVRITLNPLSPQAGVAELHRRADPLLARRGSGPYIFRPGRGVLPDTPIEHVARTVHRVAGWIRKA